MELRNYLMFNLTRISQITQIKKLALRLAFFMIRRIWGITDLRNLLQPSTQGHAYVAGRVSFGARQTDLRINGSTGTDNNQK